MTMFQADFLSKRHSNEVNDFPISSVGHLLRHFFCYFLKILSLISHELIWKLRCSYARYLEAFSLPDDLRELLDEYMDADARSEQGKECTDFFQCPYSLKDSVVRNVSNDLQ